LNNLVAILTGKPQDWKNVKREKKEGLCYQEQKRRTVTSLREDLDERPTRNQKEPIVNYTQKTEGTEGKLLDFVKEDLIRMKSTILSTRRSE